MPLQGNIRDFSTTQLLNLVNLSKRSGMLTIFDSVPTGDKDAMDQPKMQAGEERAKVAFNKGRLIYAELYGHDNGLVAILNKAGKLTDKQAEALKARSQNTSDKALAMRLMGAKYVNQNDIVTCIKQHILDVIYNLMTWSEGPFRFDDNIQPDTKNILVPIDLENVIIEGARRIREVEQLKSHIENLDVSLKFPENPKEKFKGVHLSVEEWKVVSYVSPKNTIRQIAKANNMSEMEIRRVVYGLEQAGLVIVVKPRGTGVAKRAGRRGGSKKAPPVADKKVVNKLIAKLKSL
jgi:hypothetical protein